jgi:4-aminobutyrate aminotransferase / (S)-3-amino-2-methylpropionate transaminase / 5-aminovalerate transaminase
VAHACHQAGLVVLTCGTFGNVLRFLPPLVIPENLLEEGLDIVDEAFGTVADRAVGDQVETANA